MFKEPMFESCLKKQNEIKNLFSNCITEEDRYKKIIELGRGLPKLPQKFKVPENIVQGCQSTVYLNSTLKEGLIFFDAEADALISAGLAALLIRAYSGEIPEVMLKCPPTYLEELGISASLTPSRSNGLYSMHLRMKQDALRWLLSST